MNPPAFPPASRRRSLLVTLLAVVTMLVSALLSIISVISLLMILAGGYGTQTWDPMGFLLVVVVPPLTLVAGFGLWRRWALARYYVVLVLAFLIFTNARELASGGKTTSIRTSASGETTTSEAVWGGPNWHSAPIIAASTAAIVLLFLPSVRREFGPSVRIERGAGDGGPPPLPGNDWRVGHHGRDRLYYEEYADGSWRRLDISGEMLMGPARHVIYFAPPGEWGKYPAWARNRRTEIMDRVKSALPPPDYEYYGE